jgi:hypothetical protein
MRKKGAQPWRCSHPWPAAGQPNLGILPWRTAGQSSSHQPWLTAGQLNHRGMAGGGSSIWRGARQLLLVASTSSAGGIAGGGGVHGWWAGCGRFLGGFEKCPNQLGRGLGGSFFCKIHEDRWILDERLGFNMCTTKPCAPDMFPSKFDF